MMLPFQTLTESIHEGAFLISEAKWYRSRDKIQISNAVALLTGTVLGDPGNPVGETATVIPAADNTGNGVLTMAASPTTAQAVDGSYTVEFTAPTTFNVRGPNGRVVDKGTVGTAFAGPVAFTVAAGSTAFAADDSIAIVVSRPLVTGDAWAPLAGDGSVEAAAILFSQVHVSTTPGLCTVVAMTRDCEVRASNITWPASFTPAQIAEATLQLRRRGIIIRPL